MTLAKKLRANLEPFRQAKRAMWQINYMRGQFPFLGVPAPQLRTTLSALKKEHPSSDWRQETRELWSEPEREFHYAALQWAIFHARNATPHDLPFYETLAHERAWWDTVDTIAPHLIGRLLKRFPELIERTEAWLDAPHFWLRRCALIYQLRWKGDTDAKRLFRYCTYLGSDKEWFIQKAIGWALREYSKVNPDGVREYLAGAKLASLSVREARKRLTSEALKSR